MLGKFSIVARWPLAWIWKVDFVCLEQHTKKHESFECRYTYQHSPQVLVNHRYSPKSTKPTTPQEASMSHLTKELAPRYPSFAPCKLRRGSRPFCPARFAVLSKISSSLHLTMLKSGRGRHFMRRLKAPHKAIMGKRSRAKMEERDKTLLNFPSSFFLVFSSRNSNYGIGLWYNCSLKPFLKKINMKVQSLLWDISFSIYFVWLIFA